MKVDRFNSLKYFLKFFDLELDHRILTTEGKKPINVKLYKYGHIQKAEIEKIGYGNDASEHNQTESKPLLEFSTIGIEKRRGGVSV